MSIQQLLERKRDHMVLEHVCGAVDLIVRNLPGSSDFTVNAARVRGERHHVVIDTLFRPSDMEPFRSATLIVYTHSDWDHCWGTAAFPGVPVIGHHVARERLLSGEALEYLEHKKCEQPEAFQGSAIVAPDLTFTQSMSIDAGGLTLSLEHLPGHTADSVVVHIPELDLLLAGDAVETPIPSLNEAGQIRAWAQGLRRWTEAGITCVVPSHGHHGGPELLHQNIGYIEELLGRVGHHLQQGLALEEIQKAIRVEEFVPDIDRFPQFYRQGHLANIARVMDELTSEPGNVHT